LSGVPRIFVCNDYPSWTPEFEIALTGLGNALEHLIIVPERATFIGEELCCEYWLTSSLQLSLKTIENVMH